jgi:hypothetical protein
MLKLMAAEDSLEEKRLTGTETSPKEIVAEPIDLAGMWGFDIQGGGEPGKKTLQVGGSRPPARRRCELRLTRFGSPPRFPGSEVDSAAFYHRGTEATEDSCGLCASVLEQPVMLAGMSS